MNNDVIVSNDIIDLVVTGFSHNGEGVGRYKGLAVFVPGALPGEEVEVQVTRVKKKFARGRLLKVKKVAETRRIPFCPLFERCGGCHLQHITYAEQLRQKMLIVRNNLQRIGGLSNIKVHPVMGMEDPMHYRNKIHLHAAEQDGRIKLGFYAPGSHALVALHAGQEGWCGCFLADRELCRLAGLVGQLLNKYEVSLYDRKRGTGYLRSVLLRRAAATGEAMVVLVTGRDEWPQEKQFARALRRDIPDVAAVIRNLNESKRAGDVLGRKNHVLSGKDTITDYLGPLRFAISANSFYQVNPQQTLRLYRKAQEYASLTGKETVLDAYCGVGTIALFLSSRARVVYGIETVPEAVENARANAALNNVTNIKFIKGTVEDLLPGWQSRYPVPDVVVLDPPRRGCQRGVLQALVGMRVSKVVYVSCDPGTLARDLGILAGQGYRVDEVQPVDMFPHTFHIECVARISRA
ncbi:MAG: 23S rRNA (uracil(1939)-C(5))-methyltransferase RlmD [Peptococcaceae bacterium]|nr:23S rRNA (uracil(1939)-C(5))-methyltransferase RlmD [Peptococcaceae bacterium]